ncbi:MAG: flagellar basal body L-ring protein FlgH [Amaricoccus sp.]
MRRIAFAGLDGARRLRACPGRPGARDDLDRPRRGQRAADPDRRARRARGAAAAGLRPLRLLQQGSRRRSTTPSGLLGDKRAKSVGDILTVTIEIDDQAEMKNTTTKLARRQGERRGRRLLRRRQRAAAGPDEAQPERRDGVLVSITRARARSSATRSSRRGSPRPSCRCCRTATW